MIYYLIFILFLFNHSQYVNNNVIRINVVIDNRKEKMDNNYYFRNMAINKAKIYCET